MSAHSGSLAPSTDHSIDRVEYIGRLDRASSACARRPALFRRRDGVYGVFTVSNPDVSQDTTSEFDEHLNPLLPQEVSDDASWSRVEEPSTLDLPSAYRAHEGLMKVYSSTSAKINDLSTLHASTPDFERRTQISAARNAGKKYLSDLMDVEMSLLSAIPPGTKATKLSGRIEKQWVSSTEKEMKDLVRASQAADRLVAMSQLSKDSHFPIGGARAAERNASERTDDEGSESSIAGASSTPRTTVQHLGSKFSLYPTTSGSITRQAQSSNSVKGRAEPFTHDRASLGTGSQAASESTTDAVKNAKVDDRKLARKARRRANKGKQKRQKQEEMATRSQQKASSSLTNQSVVEQDETAEIIRKSRKDYDALYPGMMEEMMKRSAISDAATHEGK